MRAATDDGCPSVSVFVALVLAASVGVSAEFPDQFIQLTFRVSGALPAEQRAIERGVGVASTPQRSKPIITPTRHIHIIARHISKALVLRRQFFLLVNLDLQKEFPILTNAIVLIQFIVE
ncbi:MAG TPA: hypothetical protein VFW76_09660, partial [Ktedonobacterales bacterium]|nr:hypothetical protein [Ktedonobacterales bacterium]